jgi:hypothetical protein
MSHEIPFGPLSPDDYALLSNSGLDGGQTELQKIARERGVVFGDASRRRFAIRLAQRDADQTGIPLDIDPGPLPIDPSYPRPTEPPAGETQ